MPNYTVIAKLAKVVEKKLKPEFHSSWAEDHEPEFKINADGKVRHAKTGAKVSAYIESLRAVTPSIFPAESETEKLKKNNPFSKEAWNITAQGSLAKALIEKHGREEGEKRLKQIAASAGGSFPGATHPGPSTRLAQRVEKGPDGKLQHI